MINLKYTINDGEPSIPVEYKSLVNLSPVHSVVHHDFSIDDLQNQFSKQWADETPLFRIISIETRTGCNFTCSFCPVAKDKDPRPLKSMSWLLLQDIANQLQDLNYQDNIFLFCNNEPLLDDRLPKIVSLFREKCPNARIKILTNGLLLSLELVNELFDNGLSTLEIDNYTDGKRVIRPIMDLIKNSKKFIEKDIRIIMRRRVEKLTNRGGTAPNVEKLTSSLSDFCALPFTDLNITPSGKVTLCCIDALAQEIVADATKESIVDIWKGNKLQHIRKGLMQGDRQISSLCSVCDYNGFRSPPSIPKFI